MKRDFQRSWRDTEYLIAKFALNIMAGLFIGFTFWRAKGSLQGTQNKLFVRLFLRLTSLVMVLSTLIRSQAIFMGTILSAPLANQLQVPFLHTRNIYEIRERPSRMYSWSALITSQILGEIPLNILGSSLYFLCWFWTVGFPSDRGGYTYLMLAIVYPLYYTTFGQAVAAMSPNPEIAALLFSFLFSFVINLYVVLLFLRRFVSR